MPASIKYIIFMQLYINKKAAFLLIEYYVKAGSWDTNSKTYHYLK